MCPSSMFRILFIETMIGLEVLRILGKSKLVHVVGEGQLLPLQNSQSKVKNYCYRINQPECARTHLVVGGLIVCA
jgi:hypothetical protein